VEVAETIPVRSMSSSRKSSGPPVSASLQECAEWEMQATVEQRCDQLALVGDGREGGRIAPGVAQIGRIVAMRLLKQYGSLERMLKQLRRSKASTVTLRRISKSRRSRILESAVSLRESRKMIQLEWCYNCSEVPFALHDRSGDVWGEPLVDWRYEAARIRRAVSHQEATPSRLAAGTGHEAGAASEESCREEAEVVPSEVAEVLRDDPVEAVVPPTREQCVSATS